MLEVQEKNWQAYQENPLEHCNVRRNTFLLHIKKAECEDCEHFFFKCPIYSKIWKLKTYRHYFLLGNENATNAQKC